MKMKMMTGNHPAGTRKKAMVMQVYLVPRSLLGYCGIVGNRLLMLATSLRICMVGKMFLRQVKLIDYITPTLG
ncbi:uncharacterized protein ASPGLDRAFT_887638 [Aspergillus glaucus CBS 516.65]|uniref:Uncharacterized protein n=1 Tax=Aspergillus glaucus CBS 516.65 TaxID=1160497 RepID=A0A1L9V8H5_ASPGL|nr:hypothetical protein ASPGLDRAFT_887638 [Aspergillus glaucus CBS 516.65]OJJ80246.1 hypothetical protein ASPGLDRAFT_887638 [Aspergillus glaucus CBS 516.65]